MNNSNTRKEGKAGGHPSPRPLSTARPSISMPRSTPGSSPFTNSPAFRPSRSSSPRASSATASGSYARPGHDGVCGQAHRPVPAVPRRRGELQPDGQGTARAFYREKGVGLALQVGEADPRTGGTQPPHCRTFRRTQKVWWRKSARVRTCTERWHTTRRRWRKGTRRYWTPTCSRTRKTGISAWAE